MRRNALYWGGILVFLCVIIAAVGYAGWRFTQCPDKPVVTVLFPSGATIVDSGEGIAVAARAESSTGIERIVLLADGQVYAEQSAGSKTSFNAVFPWYATALGAHTLEIVAYDTLDQASETVQLLIGVQAKLEPDGMDYVYIPPEDPIGSDGQPAAGRIVPVDMQAEPVGGGGGGANLPPPSESPENPIPEEILGEPITPEDVAALPPAQSVPPTITVFTAEPGRNGHQVQIHYRVEAEDDLGIVRLEFSLQNTTTGEVSSRTTLCFDVPICSAEDVYPFASAGVWLFEAQAIDTSGQASALQALAVEIVENPGFEPAIAVPDLAAIRPLIADWLRNGRPQVPIDPDVFDQNALETPGFPVGALEDIQMELTPGYALEPVSGFPPGMVRPVIQTKSVIPPVAAWSGYERLTLNIRVDSLDLPEDERGERLPLRGNPTSLRITDDIIANGYVFETAVWARCGGLNWDVHWELIWNGQVIEVGPVSTVRTTPCLPPPSAAPVITGLQGYYGNSDRICHSGPACSLLTWESSNHPAPIDPNVELPMDTLGVYRWAAFTNGRLDALGGDPAGFLDETLWYVPVDYVEFVQGMLCIPPNATLVYGFTLVPMTWIGPGETIYSNDGTTVAYIDACQSRTYDAVGRISPR